MVFFKCTFYIYTVLIKLYCYGFSVISTFYVEISHHVTHLLICSKKICSLLVCIIKRPKRFSFPFLRTIKTLIIQKKEETCLEQLFFGYGPKILKVCEVTRFIASFIKSLSTLHTGSIFYEMRGDKVVPYITEINLSIIHEPQ